MTNRIEVSVTIGDRQVTLVGPEDFVREEVQRLTNLVAPPVARSSAGMQAPVDGDVPPTEREFVAQKRPIGHLETVAVLGYFLSKSGHPEFTPEDIKRAYVRAGVRGPKQTGQALRDAKNVKDFLQTGAERGSFRLSEHGERTVVFDLPRQDKSK